MNSQQAKLLDAQYKDSSPMATVAKIKGLLAAYGIETEEKWSQSGVPYCYAMSIKIPGTTFSANGKGLTEEFALASGYGELMERLQLGYVNGAIGKTDGKTASVYAVPMDAAQLVKDNLSWYQKIAQRAEKLAGVRIDPRNLVLQYAQKDGTVPTLPFYNITKDCAAFLPERLFRIICTTNGSAAGNSPEETIVQAISEIVERYHQMRVITENLVLPDVPEDALKKFETAYKIITYVRKCGYRVLIKDCSLGTGFPVVCACFINLKTGRYHTHFGAYPLFEIALERSLTESFQGRTIENIGVFEDFMPEGNGAYQYASIFNEMSQGSWKKAASFFCGTPDFACDPVGRFDGENNAALLRQCLDYFHEMGYEVLIRDSSCLGFCTYQVVIPGYSEMFPHRAAFNSDEQRFSEFAVKTLRDPAKASIQDYLGFLMHMEEQKKYTANLIGVHGFSALAKLPVKLDKNRSDFMVNATLAYVYYAMGRKNELLKCLDAMIARSEDISDLVCLKQYLILKSSGKDASVIRSMLELFHSADAVDRLYERLSSGRNPLEPYVLHCDLQCSAECPLVNSCCYRRSQIIAGLLNEKYREMDFDAFCDYLRAMR